MKANQKVDTSNPHPAPRISGARTQKVCFGVLKGSLRYPSDFDAPLPARILALFDGRRKG